MDRLKGYTKPSLLNHLALHGLKTPASWTKNRLIAKILESKTQEGKPLHSVPIEVVKKPATAKDVVLGEVRSKINNAREQVATYQANLITARDSLEKRRDYGDAEKKDMSAQLDENEKGFMMSQGKLKHYLDILRYQDARGEERKELEKRVFEKLESLKIDPPAEFGETGKVLQHYQNNFMKSFNFNDKRGALMLFGVGTGKTLTALATGLRYLQLYPTNKLVICTPKALTSGWIDEIINIGLNPFYEKIVFTTYDNIIGRRTSLDILKNSMLICDEGHLLRTEVKEEEQPTKEGETIKVIRSGKKVGMLMAKNKLAHKTLILTGTPFVNSNYDVYNLLVLANGSQVVYDRKTFDASLLGPKRDAYNDANIHNYFDYKCDFYYLKKYDVIDGKKVPNIIYKLYPTVKMHYHLIPMDKSVGESYGKLELTGDVISFNDDDDEEELKKSYTDSFFYKSRLISNVIGEMDNKKIEFIISQYRKKIEVDGVEYQRRVVVYSTFVQTFLKILKMRLAKEGIKYLEVSGTRKDATDKWLSGEINMFIISKAGTEGLNLLRCDDLFIVESLFNDASTNQAIARGVRFGSHRGHHSNSINIWRLLMCLEKEMDEAEKAIKLIESAETELIEEGTVNEKITQQFFKNYYEKDVKGRTAVQFKSVDVNLLVFSYYKQMTLNKFFYHIQKTAHPLTTLNNEHLVELELSIKNDNERRIKKGEKALTVKEVNTIINEYMLTKMPKVREAILDGITYKEPPKVNARNKLFQEYLTPDKLAEDVADSFIDWGKHGGNLINVLEPTAGQGNLIDALRKTQKESANVVYNAVEFQKINVDIMKNKYKGIPNVIVKQGDFMEFADGVEYDYIFMNPPFNLKVKFNGKQLKDVDFVEKCYYDHLRDGGKLRAIVWQNSYKKLEYEVLKDVVKIHNKTETFLEVHEDGDYVKKRVTVSVLTIIKGSNSGEYI